MRPVLKITRLSMAALLASGVALAQKPAESKPAASAPPTAKAQAAPGKAVAAPKIEISQ